MNRSLFRFFLLSFLTCALSVQATPLHFDHLTINDGLPENSVRSILQDRYGFLWFGTQNGVARYDGTDMNIYLPDPDNEASIGIRFVLAMAEDSAGSIWMGSYTAGISVYNPVTDQFTNFATDTDSLPGPGITAIKQADDGIWITTARGRLHKTQGQEFELVDVPVFGSGQGGGFTGLDVTTRELWVGSDKDGIAWKDRTNGSWRHLKHSKSDPESLPSDYITFIQRDSYGRIWVGSRAGLALHRGNGKFKVFKPDSLLNEAEINYLVCFSEDPRGTFWIGSAAGLYSFDPNSESFTLHPNDPDRPTSPEVGPILSVLADRSGIVWAGSWHTGLNKYDSGSTKFEVFLSNPKDTGSLDNDSIGAVFEDSQGTLWVGTGSRSTGGSDGDLNYRLSGQEFFSHIALPMTEEQEQVRTVHSIVEDPNGMLWLGTDRGLWQLGTDRQKIVRPPSLGKASVTLRQAMITDLALDRAGRVWVANWLGGLHRFDPLLQTWDSYRAADGASGGLISNDLTAITMDDQGRIWAGTDSGGLYLYHPLKDSFVLLNHLGGNLVAVLHIAAAGQGRVLLSTGSGIHLCDDEKVLRSYTTRDGLSSDFIGLLVQDENKNIWASTGLGLVRIDAQTSEIRLYDERDGLPRNELYFSVCRTTDGHIFFGGLHGLISFHPDHLKASSFQPPMHITDILVQDESLQIGPDSPLLKALTHTDEIHLGHLQNDISLSFAALDYAHPERNKYRFRLEPHDADWRRATKTNMAHYTNLDPGTYLFSVMGSNSDGIWNETPAELRIIIAPPWYRTKWSVALYIGLLLALTSGVLRHLINRERMRLALELQQAEARNLQELNQLKSHFFTNISHEFRTPLTLLMSPLRRLQEAPTSGTTELFDTMARNARRLARLIDQLLDLSRLEASRMPSYWKQGDWCQYLKALASSFSSLAEQRKIVFHSRWPETSEHAWYDPDILDKVLVNLLSNALKFTPVGGEVTLTVSVSGESGNHPWPGKPRPEDLPGTAYVLILKVHNTGSHIPPEELDLVFDRFHQVVDNTDFGDVGSGIGLAMVQELTKWCHGSADVTSDPLMGTEFSISLPLYVDTPPGVELVADKPDSTESETMDETQDELFLDDEVEEIAGNPLPTVLLVEDNADLRSYVRFELQDEFHIILAADGHNGLETARSEIPDLILSDVMMPKMDGYELCSNLKADFLTNHIPVILLTAKADTSSRKEGLKAGADDYVAKPFDVEELRIRIRNLIEQRKLLAQRYANLEEPQPGKVANPAPSADDRFLVKAREIIVTNMEDPDFRVDQLCREVGMSRTQLHRKLTAVAGRSAGEFIRIERLNKAAEMLGNKEGNVTEVAYSVGYRSLSQFAKAFREHFGMVPSDFES